MMHPVHVLHFEKKLKNKTQITSLLFVYIKSSAAIAEGPRDALSQLRSCQLLHNCTKNHIWLEGLPFHVV